MRRSPLRRRGALLMVAASMLVFCWVSIVEADTAQPEAKEAASGAESLHVVPRPDQPMEDTPSTGPATSGWRGPPTLSGALIGLGIGLISFVLKELVLSHQRSRARTRQYRVALTSTRDEIDFHLGKLRQLITEADRMEQFLRTGSGKLVVPTYSLYPRFLEDSKRALSSFQRNADLVKKVGKCHFELSHIAERLERVKRAAYAGDFKALPLVPDNMKGLVGLIRDCIKLFEETLEVLNQEIRDVRARLARGLS